VEAVRGRGDGGEEAPGKAAGGGGERAEEEEGKAPQEERVGPPGRTILIDLAALKLRLVEDGRVVGVYPIAAGRPSSPTPRGEFEVTAIVKNPTWYPRHGAPVPPGPANPLGSRWISMSRSAYGIHGTNDPSSIGRLVSNGCVRMHNEHVEELCRLICVGTPIVVTEGGGAADAYARRAGRRTRGDSVE
jgi:hypothetical protein